LKHWGEGIVQPDPGQLIEVAGITIPLIGFYDTPDPSPFFPLVRPAPESGGCVFAFFKCWLKGETLHLTHERYGCGGAGHWLFGKEMRSREDFVDFLVDEEGLKASRELMDQWLDERQPYLQEHDHILIGPLSQEAYGYLRTVTFLVNPDQLGLLMLGAQYHSGPGDIAPVVAPFGSGCMQLASLFQDLNAAQAVVGATDIAMRQYLPEDILAFTVTRPMFEQLCSLDERSFLFKPFWKRLRKARGSA
jgi:hypothetical protein